MTLRAPAPDLKPAVARVPEILAPVGDQDSLAAALAAGADAVYLGLDEGFNARARAVNFSRDNLVDVVRRCHAARCRVFVTMNTLVFEGELDRVADLIADIARAGVDALIVQDPAVCLMAREICGRLDLHASTQMTVSSLEGIAFARSLGVCRVVVPRELSVAEIAHLCRHTDMELEVFIHGALCMSWSGQCLTSEAWGGRSANRGQCAQSCRLPYELVVDGETMPTGDIRYLLSPLDLAGHRAVPALMEAGVHSLKIEGRLKGPAYVQTTVEGMRRWVQAIASGEAHLAEAQRKLRDDLAAAMVTYSRGFSDGFLAGSDHQTLVEGRFPKHRGAFLGEVARIEGTTVWVRPRHRTPRPGVGPLLAPLPALGGAEDAATGAAATPVIPRAGMGIGFDGGRPHQDEPGGPVWEVEEAEGMWGLRFARGFPLPTVRPGDRVWVTGDPQRQREAERAVQGPAPGGRWAVDLRVAGREGGPLEVWCTGPEPWMQGGPWRSDRLLLASQHGPGLSSDLLRDKLGALGGTSFQLRGLDAEALAPGLFVAPSALKQVRRQLVEALEASLLSPPLRPVRREDDLVPGLRASLRSLAPVAPPVPPVLVPLCRTPEQLEAVLEAGLPEVELDWMEMVGLGQAVARAREAGLRVVVATVRVQKPGEEGFDRRIERLAPDGVLIRHWGALMHFAGLAEERRPTLHGDFSLNVTNSLTWWRLRGMGLHSLTAAHDLDAAQLHALLGAVDPGATTVTVHHHIPMFHTEHCVYAHMLSQGRDWRTCGRPCEAHRVALRDPVGHEHPVIVDVGCRNTVFNARAQSAATLWPSLHRAGVGRLRVEFVWEDRAQAATVLAAWKALLAGELDPRALHDRVGTHEQFGVSAGTMQVLR
jgi:putative protease